MLHAVRPNELLLETNLVLILTVSLGRKSFDNDVGSARPVRWFSNPEKQRGVVVLGIVSPEIHSKDLVFVLVWFIARFL